MSCRAQQVTLHNQPPTQYTLFLFFNIEMIISNWEVVFSFIFFFTRFSDWGLCSFFATAHYWRQENPFSLHTLARNVDFRQSRNFWKYRAFMLIENFPPLRHLGGKMMYFSPPIKLPHLRPLYIKMVYISSPSGNETATPQASLWTTRPCLPGWCLMWKLPRSRKSPKVSWFPVFNVQCSNFKIFNLNIFS